MDKQFSKKFILKSLLIFLVLVVGSFLIRNYFSDSHTFFVFLVPIVALLINIIAFYASVNKTTKQNFSTLISALFGIKFFSYLVLSLVFFLLEKEQSVRLIFIGFLFVSYLSNTLLLLANILKLLRSSK